MLSATTMEVVDEALDVNDLPRFNAFNERGSFASLYLVIVIMFFDSQLYFELSQIVGHRFTGNSFCIHRQP